MKNTLISKIGVVLLAVIFGMTACFDDLDRYPTNDFTDGEAYSSFDGYKSVLAKIYSAYATIGNDGPSLQPDIEMGDGSTSDFLRCLFNTQSLTTEEAICTWTDNGIPDLNFMSWSASNAFINGLYYRAVYQITLVNEFLRQSTDSKLSSRGIVGAEADEIRQFRNEVRFVRAYQYWILMDAFGNPPFVDENTPMGKYLPLQISRADLFDYVESELLDIESKIKDEKTNEYGRADKAAVWALLARVYLNAEVYAGTPKYTEAITFSNKVISGNKYSLKTNYEELFMADNQKNNPEVILSINYDGQKTKTYGGLTFVINASFIIAREDVPGVNFQEYFGMGGLGGWYGNRARKEFADKFDNDDSRKLLYGAEKDISSVSTFTEGVAVAKFRNVTSTGEYGSNFAEAFPDTDFPLFRLAEMHFVYAESILRGGTGGTMINAVEYMNLNRRRAFGDLAHDFVTINLQQVLDERARELYWEGFRRTDLVRYGLYTSGTYLWQWKGGVKSGRAVSSDFNIFPIPSADLMANPNLKQNTGY